jgi:hypothetical protein
MSILRPGAKVLSLVSLMAVLLPATAFAVELRDAELVAGGNAIFQNGLGTVRLEGARLGRVAKTVFVPEPGGLWQLGSGAGLVARLAKRRRRSYRAMRRLVAEEML